MVSAVNPLRNPSASRTGAGFARVADRDQCAGFAENHALHRKSPRYQRRRLKTLLLHGIDSLRTHASQRRNFIKSESGAPGDRQGVDGASPLR